ncbi:unnamed protein product [Protopolystoma xenopodis]|uniref:Uncharacterized protein n=1 Tax=Protopolystoma xenopodis TaxID=117903 RepID=A0A3S5B8P8_9PLAT|nr:unnamed protein product [Protopolystoma xenopodis]
MTVETEGGGCEGVCDWFFERTEAAEVAPRGWANGRHLLSQYETSEQLTRVRAWHWPRAGWTETKEEEHEALLSRQRSWAGSAVQLAKASTKRTLEMVGMQRHRNSDRFEEASGNARHTERSAV